MRKKIKFNTSTQLYFDRLSIRPERAKRVEGLSVKGERPSTTLGTSPEFIEGRSRTINLKNLRFDKQGLIPAIIQDYRSGEVLMLGFMNAISLKRTLKLGKTCFWSRSRKEYWIKGATSGNYQFVKSIYYDCDMDALLIKVRQVGVACHTGKRSCFYSKI